jgi:hypothetical protein
VSPGYVRGFSSSSIQTAGFIQVLADALERRVAKKTLAGLAAKFRIDEDSRLHPS